MDFANFLIKYNGIKLLHHLTWAEFTEIAPLFA